MGDRVRTTVVLSLVLLMLLSGVTLALDRPITVYLDGQQLQFDQPPMLENGSTLVPLRAVFQALGANVDFDPVTQEIVATKGEKIIRLTVGDPNALVGDKPIVLAAPPMVIGGRTLVPLRFVSEALGANVAWDGTTSTVTITSPVVTSDTKPSIPSALLRVHFIDVGQAESILTDLPNGGHILIDGGNNADGDLVVQYIKNQGITRLDYVIATHPHEDHIGGLDTAIQNLEIGAVYAPNAVTTTKTFEDFLSAVEQKGLGLTEAKAGIVLDLEAGVSGRFIGPTRTDYEELNTTSAVLRIAYGETAFLFTGDAERLAETDMLSAGQVVDADVLKVGHHGSNSSTSSMFLQAVSPTYAVISVGEGNDYGHPIQATLDALESAGVQIYRTDIQGTIVASSDGKTVSFDKSASPVQERAPDATEATSGIVIDSIDLSREIVIIRNTGSATVDLSGWKLVSEVGAQTYVFPAGTRLAAGSNLMIVSGPAAQAGTDMLVWTTNNIWNNNGDLGALYNAHGQLIDRH